MEDFEGSEDQDQDQDLDEEEAGWLADKMHILHIAIYCNTLFVLLPSFDQDQSKSGED